MSKASRWRSIVLRAAAPAVCVVMLSWSSIASSQKSVAPDPAEPPQANAPSEEREKIRVSADNLVVESGGDTARFWGNVQVVQGNLIIRADQIEIRLSGLVIVRALKRYRFSLVKTDADAFDFVQAFQAVPADLPEFAFDAEAVGRFHQSRVIAAVVHSIKRLSRRDPQKSLALKNGRPGVSAPDTL